MVAAMNLAATFGVEPPAPLDSEFTNVIVIDGLPVAPVAKFEKLVAMIRKNFIKFGPITEGGLYIPIDDETQQTVGYGFIEYEEAESAAAAVATMDKTALDKKHTFLVCPWSDFDRLQDYSNDYVAAERSDFQLTDNLQSWQLDDHVRDQFVLRYADETQVMWHDPLMNEGMRPCYGGEEQKLSGKNWTELLTAWSPLGSYFATFHDKGVMLWGGQNWANLGRFGHADVRMVAFSPCEKFIVTYSGIEAKQRGDPECIQVHEVRSGKLLRGFPGVLPGQKETQEWPIFKWSHDDRYFARLGVDEINVYDSTTMKLIDGKPVKTRAAQEFEWSPSQHIISFWSPEMDNIPVSVSLISIPDRVTIREKHLFNVFSVSLHWQSAGDFLCVKVARQKSKSKAKVTKIVSTNFEIFRLMEKDVPVEVLDFKEPSSTFAWEPRGSRFAIIHGEGFANKYNVSFYSVKKTKIRLEFTTPEPRLVNALFWSPMGSYIVLAGLGQMNGILEFYDVNRKAPMATSEHFMCTDVIWCPSGVYVTTAVMQPLHTREAWRFANENGYKIWTFQGVLKHENSLEQFYQFMWRPRPATLLSREEQGEIRNTVREVYYKKFDDEDEVVRQSQLSSEARARTDAKKKFREYRARCEADLRADAAERQRLRHGVASDAEDDYEVTELEIEEETDMQEIVMP